MKLKSFFVAAVVVTLSLTATVNGNAAERVGFVKLAVGDVTIIRNGQHLQAAHDLTLFEGDVVETAANGKTGLILDDDTAISMGHSSKLVLARFMFRPKEHNLLLVARLLHGTLSFISGKIAKLAPGWVRIETPHATIGVRGTHVLVRVE